MQYIMTMRLLGNLLSYIVMLAIMVISFSLAMHKVRKLVLFMELHMTLALGCLAVCHLLAGNAFYCTLVVPR